MVKIVVQKGRDQATVFRIDGNLGSADADTIRSLVIPDSSRVVFDLRGVRVLDRPGLAALVSVFRRVSRSGERVRVTCSAAVLSLLSREGFDRLYPMGIMPEGVSA